MRKSHIFIIAGLLIVLAGGAWYALSVVQTTKDRALAQAGVAPLPNLSRVPGELEQRIRDATAAVGRSRQPVKALGQLAILYQANEFTEEAAQALHILRTLDPDNGRWPYLLARVSMERNNLDRLERHLLDTVRLAPDYSPAYVRLGDLYSNLQRFDEARANYQRRAELNPNDPLSGMGLASLDVRDGNVERAIERLRTLLERHPRLTQPNLLLAELLDRLGERESALRHFQIAQEGAPEWNENDPWLTELNEQCFLPSRLLRLGHSRVEAGWAEDGLPFFEKAARLAPDNEQVQSTLAAAYGFLDRLEDQQSVLRQGIRRAPRTSLLYFDLANLFVELDRAGEAVTLIEEGLREAPERADLQEALGIALRHADRPDEGIAALRRATEMNPQRSSAFLELGRALLFSGNRDEGRRQLQRAVEVNPGNAEAIYTLASLALEDGNIAQAKQLATNLIQLAPQDFDVRSLYAGIALQEGNEAFQAGDLQRAEAIYRAGIEVVPDSGTLYGAIGLMHAKADRMDEAIVEYERYLMLTPTDSRAYVLLGDALDAVGRVDHARQIYRAAQQLAQRAGDDEMFEGFEELIANLGQPAGEQQGASAQ